MLKSILISLENLLSYVKNLKNEFKEILNIFLPTLACIFIENSQYTIDIIVIGRLNNALLIGACGIGSSFGAMTLIAFVFGLCSALETLCSQAFGAKNFELYGRSVNRGIFCVTILISPFLLINIYSENILILIGFDPILAKYSSKYLRYQIPYMLMTMQFEVIRRYLLCQRETKIQLYAISVSVLIHICLSILFVHYLKLNLIGLSISHNISITTALIIVLIYIRNQKRFAKTWVPISIADFAHWGQFLALGLPGIAMILPEFWAFCMNAFFSGYFSKEQASASYSLNQLSSLAYNINLSVGVSLCTLAGNAIGKKNRDKVSQYLFASLIIYGISAFFIEILYIFGRNILPLIFTTISEIDQMISKALLILCVQIIFDGLQGLLGFLLKGMGKQKEACIGNLISFIIIYLIVALSLAFLVPLQFYGLWIGFTISCLSAFIFYTTIYLGTDWNDLFKKVDREIAISNI